jgi:hypothetical protein
VSVCVCVCVCVCVRGACACVCVCVCVCVCEWRGEFNRLVLVVKLGLIFHFILNQLVTHICEFQSNTYRHYLI